MSAIFERYFSMPSDQMDSWLTSGRPARILDLPVRPLANPTLEGTALSVSKGQAESFVLASEAGTRWILKKFHNGRDLDRSYLEAIATVLPRQGYFASGTARQVLRCESLNRDNGSYYTSELADFLDEAILMPKVYGADWAALADEVREGGINLTRTQRVTLCRELAAAVSALEQNLCSHRDLSSGNVFIDAKSWTVCLIDFDSLYHPSLLMPPTTTGGTIGYTPPFVWRGDQMAPEVTWIPCADRYALALLSIEILVMGPDAPLAGDGGVFDQEQLRQRRGDSLDFAADRLRSDFSSAVPLFQAAIASNRFDECPSPDDWKGFCAAELGPTVKPPSLSEMETVLPDLFADALAGRLDGVSSQQRRNGNGRLQIHPGPVVSLPPDPWSP